MKTIQVSEALTNYPEGANIYVEHNSRFYLLINLPINGDGKTLPCVNPSNPPLRVEPSEVFNFYSEEEFAVLMGEKETALQKEKEKVSQMESKSGFHATSKEEAQGEVEKKEKELAEAKKLVLSSPSLSSLSSSKQKSQ